MPDTKQQRIAALRWAAEMCAMHAMAADVGRGDEAKAKATALARRATLLIAMADELEETKRDKELTALS